MDELTAVLRARSFVNKVAPSSLPVPVEAYAADAGAKVKVSTDLGEDEDGFSMQMPSGKFGICVNGNQTEQRQRFTICHELAHVLLGLPSEHGTEPSWSYAKRAPNEVLCDVFAAELLLPYKLFKPFVDDASYSLSTVSSLAQRFGASLLATGSRFAALASLPCAFVLCESGKVRYASRSASLRDARGWIKLGTAIPEDSLAFASREKGSAIGPEEADTDVWFPDWERDGTLIEDACHLPSYDQTVALLWFEDDPDLLRPAGATVKSEDLYGLAELDGVLPWPGKSKRRR